MYQGMFGTSTNNTSPFEVQLAATKNAKKSNFGKRWFIPTSLEIGGKFLSTFKMEVQNSGYICVEGKNQIC